MSEPWRSGLRLAMALSGNVPIAPASRPPGSFDRSRLVDFIFEGIPITHLVAVCGSARRLECLLHLEAGRVLRAGVLTRI